MQVSALIAVRLAEAVIGLNARGRWHATHNLNSGDSFMTSGWFTVAMVIVLAVSIVSFLLVTLIRKVKELKSAERVFLNTAARKGLTTSQSDMLMAIAINAGIKKNEEIFGMSEAFERGAEKLLSQSRSGRQSGQTARLEKQLAELREKLRFRKVSSASAKTLPDLSEKTPAVTQADALKKSAAFIALFPFERNISLSANGKQEQLPQGSSSSQSGTGAEWSRRLPEFLPVTVAGVTDQVVFVETMLAANVGDRVLIVIGPRNVSGDASGQELFEDIGFVKQSIQPAELIKEPNARRLGIGLTGLNEDQIARLTSVIAAAKTTAEARPDVVNPQEAEGTQLPIGAKEASK